MGWILVPFLIFLSHRSFRFPTITTFIQGGYWCLFAFIFGCWCLFLSSFFILLFFFFFSLSFMVFQSSQLGMNAFPFSWLNEIILRHNKSTLQNHILIDIMEKMLNHLGTLLSTSRPGLGLISIRHFGLAPYTQHPRGT